MLDERFSKCFWKVVFFQPNFPHILDQRIKKDLFNVFVFISFLINISHYLRDKVVPVSHPKCQFFFGKQSKCRSDRLLNGEMWDFGGRQSCQKVMTLGL